MRARKASQAGLRVLAKICVLIYVYRMGPGAGDALGPTEQLIKEFHWFKC